MTKADSSVKACIYSQPSSSSSPPSSDSFFIDLTGITMEKTMKYIINGIFGIIWIVGTLIAIKNGLKCGNVFKNKAFNFLKALIFGPLYAIWLRFSCKPHLF